MCGFVLRDPFTVVLTSWTALQLTWVTMLLFVQLVQISRATTTYENMKGHGHHHDSRASQAVTAALVAGTTSLDGAQVVPSGNAPVIEGMDTHSHGAHDGHRHGQQHSRDDGFFAQWKRLLGLDTFMATAQDSLDNNSQSRWRKNPYSRGVLTNCRDFWVRSRPLLWPA